jgi:hypothetical protein
MSNIHLKKFGAKTYFSKVQLLQWKYPFREKRPILPINLSSKWKNRRRYAMQISERLNVNNHLLLFQSLSCK